MIKYTMSSASFVTVDLFTCVHKLQTKEAQVEVAQLQCNISVVNSHYTTIAANNTLIITLKTN